MIEMKFDYKELLDHLLDGVYFVDTERQIHYWNKAAEKITGFSASEVVGRRCWENILRHVDDQGTELCESFCPLVEVIASGVPRRAEVFLHHKDGHRVSVLVRIVPVRDAEGKVVGAVELFSDNSPKASILARVAQLEELVMLDPLTRLGNRRFIEINIQSRLDEMNRYGFSFGLLFLDIDHFKRINDKYGHDIGDKVLIMVANTLATNSRPFDVFGRWGGEEFVGIIQRVDPRGLYAIADRFRSLVGSSFLIEGKKRIHATVSIGACVAREGDSLERLIKKADDLMYQSKSHGRDWVSMDEPNPAGND